MARFALIYAALASLLLGACASTPGTRHGEMLLDTRHQQLCYHADANCLDLGLIIANANRDRILREFGLYPWDWNPLDSIEELNRLLLNPPNQLYQVERLDTYSYRLPINSATLEVWRVLEEEYRDRYWDGDCRGLFNSC